MSKVLITGGAGFIGSHVADALLEAGYAVRVLDNLCPQVHATKEIPDYLSTDVEFVYGDIRDERSVRMALRGVDAVVHLAAVVGVGQSMYKIGHYTSVNNYGTAILLEALTRDPVARLVVASSMSIYGEGLYRNGSGEPVDTVERSREHLDAARWEPRDNEGGPLHPTRTPEWKRPSLSSVYALSKYDQEQLCLTIGKAYKIPTVALRFFNVYGPRQALSNPYTGVLAIFAARLLNNRPPLVYEDGEQRRDFVHVSDVARACKLALEADAVANEVFNVASGRAFTVREMAGRLGDILDRPIPAEITGQFRAGDIRHCYADISKAEWMLNYRPEADFEAALTDLAEWLSEQQVEDNVEEAHNELLVRGLAT